MFLAALAALALAAGGCTRKATLVQDQGGSASSVSPDSTAQMLHDVQQAWDAQSDDAHAATLTLQIVRQELLGLPPATWGSRTEDLLDSLGVGVETAGGPCAMMVNVFVRSDPGRGSWPAFFWCDGSNVRMQEVEGRGMRLLGAVSETRLESSPNPIPVRVAGLFARPSGGRQQPVLMAWSRKPKDTRWKLAQTLGADSLGGFGTGGFETPGDTVTDLVTRTFQTPRGFEECNTCPHMTREHRFRWRPSGFQRIYDRDIPSTYATFVRLIEALQHGSPTAAAFVRDPGLIELANQYQWDRSKGAWRVAPGTEEAGSVLTFFRGSQEAYRVTFEPRDDDWVVNGIQPVPRAVE